MRIFVAGHKGMVGSALLKVLNQDSNNEILTQSRSQLDLLQQNDVNKFFKNNNIDQVYLAAARVGGILANNTYPAEFILQNLKIQNNILESSHLYDVNKVLFLGSSCIYPKFSEQPIKEESLLSGSLESTNEPYAVAKIAGIKVSESFNRQFGRDYRSVMPTNLYGPNDNFHPKNSHVIPALIDRIHHAKISKQNEVIIWGSGKPKREFLHVDDMADAAVFIMNIQKDIFEKEVPPMMSHINIGTGEDVSISLLASKISEVVGFEGELIFDDSKPDGAPRKLLDVSKLKKLGWSSKIKLEDGLLHTYKWYLKNIKLLRHK